MREISLAQKPEKLPKEAVASVPKETYPSFSIYDKAPEELMKYDIGKEFTAKVTLNSKKVTEGDKKLNTIGFEVLSIIMDTKETQDEKIKRMSSEAINKQRKLK